MKIFMVIFIIGLSIFLLADSYPDYCSSQRPISNGLCQLTLDSKNKGKEIIGKEYVFGPCDEYFTLTQFVEPNLLLLSWIPEQRYCWSYQRILMDRKLLLQMSDQKSFEEMRRKRGYIGKLSLGRIGFKCGGTKFIVTDLNETPMTDGRIINIAVIKKLKEDNQSKNMQ